MADARTQINEGLLHSLGPVITTALREPDVLEVMVNPDGGVWIDRFGRGMELQKETMGYHQARDVVILVAASLSFEATVGQPVVQGELPLDGSRFHGILPPNVSPQASFTIRKKAEKIFTLEDYVAAGSLAEPLYQDLRRALSERKNILVVGGTGSGKTTLLNGLIQSLTEMCPEHRLLILEDTLELQCASLNKVMLKTSGALSMQKLVENTMRFRPDRIVVGEVRDEAALDMLKAWNTGHPGGLATVHANSAEEGLYRLEELAEEAGRGPKQKLIGRSVDMILFIQKTAAGGREITEAIAVKGYDSITQTYKTETIYHAR